MNELKKEIETKYKVNLMPKGDGNWYAYLGNSELAETIIIYMNNTLYCDILRQWGKPELNNFWLNKKNKFRKKGIQFLRDLRVLAKYKEQTK